jgi:hypothetical protein
MEESCSAGKTQQIQTGRLPSKIKTMLDSSELDLVQLGANMMKAYIPKEKWEQALEMFSFDKTNENLYIRKWFWDIVDDEIYIIIAHRSKSLYEICR